MNLTPTLGWKPAHSRLLHLRAGLALGCLLGLGQSGYLWADEVRLPIAEHVRQSTAQDLPGKGTSMAMVESQHGAPARRTDPVGRPPISQWHYPAFVVYFENSHVIHAVARHKGGL